MMIVRHDRDANSRARRIAAFFSKPSSNTTGGYSAYRIIMTTPGTIWASTVGWGRNAEAGHDPTSAWLAETSLTFNDRDAWFGRFELAQKPAHDLAIDTIDGRDDLFTVAKLQGGYTRYLSAWNGWKPGIGATVSTGIVPASLRAVYGGRANFGFGVFLTLRPAAAPM